MEKNENRKLIEKVLFLKSYKEKVKKLTLQGPMFEKNNLLISLEQEDKKLYLKAFFINNESEYRFKIAIDDKTKLKESHIERLTDTLEDQKEKIIKDGK